MLVVIFCETVSDAGVPTTAIGARLELLNVSRDCADVYECTASNNIPPSVKRHIKLTVECTLTLIMNL